MLFHFHANQIEDIILPRVDMNFIFECSTRYLTRSLRSLVRCRVKHEKIKFISTSGHVIFCLIHKHINGDVFDNFPKISDQFPKISENFPKFFRRQGERLRTFLGHFPKITEDFRRFPRKFRDTHGQGGFCYQISVTPDGSQCSPPGIKISGNRTPPCPCV